MLSRSFDTRSIDTRFLVVGVRHFDAADVLDRRPHFDAIDEEALIVPGLTELEPSWTSNSTYSVLIRAIDAVCGTRGQAGKQESGDDEDWIVHSECMKKTRGK